VLGKGVLVDAHIPCDLVPLWEGFVAVARERTEIGVYCLGDQRQVPVTHYGLVDFSVSFAINIYVAEHSSTSIHNFVLSCFH